MFKLTNKTIIAMKGHPFTRKTEFANLIAAHLRCPVLSLDNFLDSLCPNHVQISSSLNDTCTPHPQDLAFEIICKIVESNLSNGFVENIVIDSPLSSRSHLDQLIQLAESIGKTRLVLVETKTDNLYQWQAEFEDLNRGSQGRWQHKCCKAAEEATPAEDFDLHTMILDLLIEKTCKWYKAKTWEDIKMTVREGYDERCDGYKVPKLVLDPLLDYQVYDEKLKLTPPFIDAVQYMIRRSEDDGPDLVVYHLWRRGYYLSSNKSCENGHNITNYTDEGLGYEAICMACENRVTGSAYTCKHCTFALHKECVELLDDDNNPSGVPPPDNLELLSWRGCRYVYPELEFRCTSCKEKDIISDSCRDCLFTTHLKSRFLPTVIRHDCDEHFLSVGLSGLNPYEDHSLCKACGESIESVWYSCKSCHVSYHYQCLTKVCLRVEHEHGGHHHHMSLQYSSKKADDYICDVCFEREVRADRRDPSLWFYSCDKCQYVAHLHCVDDGKTYSDLWIMRTRPLENLQQLLYPKKK